MGETAREAVTVKDKKDMTAQNQDANTRDINQMGVTSTVKGERLVPRVLLRLRVLLVEADDSTRRIIAALLRKCSYRVSAVPDGLRAWETLKRKPHNVDLILTEVELPSISGYALLTLVMEHEICKSIPVIMMSSKDSINLILKCMLKGAADFLIKPVRRNELRNLWQHVWRRQITAGNVHHSAAVIEQKVEATSENNVTSNTSNVGVALTEKNHQVSMEESDTQDVFTRTYADACKLNDAEVHEECAKIIEESAMAKSGPETNAVKYGEQLAHCNEAYYSVTVKMGDDPLVAKSSIKEPRSHSSIDEMSSGTEELVKAKSVIDLTRNFIKCEPNADGQWCAKNGTQNFNVSPPLELSLGRFFPTHSKEGGNEERHKLRRSKASAFSKYDNRKICQPVFPTTTGVSSISEENANASDNQLFNQHPAVYTLRGHVTNGQQSLTSSEPGQSGKSRGAFPQVGLGFFTVARVRSEGGHCPPMLHAQPGFSPVWSSKSQDEQSPIPTGSSTHSTSEVQNPEQGFCSFVQTANVSAEEKEQANYNKLKTMEAKRVFSPTPGSCDFSNSVANNLGTAVSTSIYSTSEENSTLAPDVRTTDLSERIDDNGVQVINGQKGVVSYCTNQREAALIKFRLKRKDRCYQKKVRYQSRKRLAEQRPRVKGQFVRQVQSEMPNVAAGSCT